MARVAIDDALIEIERAAAHVEVIRDPDVRVSYATDASEVEPCLPDAVVRVRSAAEVAAVMAVANARRIPVTPRAGGTSRVGGAVPVHGGIVLSVEALTQIHEINARDGLAVVDAGVVTGELHRTLEDEGLFYAPDPNSAASCLIGGNIGTNAAGPRAFKYGVTRDHVLGLEIVTGSGETMRVGRRTTKGVTGYDLTALVVGSEGTLAIVTRATLRVLPKPATVATLLVCLTDERAVAPAIDGLLAARLRPRCIELLDRVALAIVREAGTVPLPSEPNTLLIVELDGEPEVVDRDVEQAGQRLLDAGALEVLVARDAGDRERLWAVRRDLSHSMRKKANHKLSEDVVVPRSQIGAILDRCRTLADEHRITIATYGHAGDGNLHANFLWDDDAQRPGVDRAIGALFESVVQMGGTLSGEHGIGVLKAPYLPLEQTEPVREIQRQLKAVFDPHGVLNPGKIFSPAGGLAHRGC